MLPPWVIVVTKSASEEAAERCLRAAGYRAYLPRYRKMLLPHGGARRPDHAMRPLFDRLVFVQDWRGWPKISIAGALGLMSARPGVAKLSDVDVALIMERERAGDFDQATLGGMRNDLVPGDQVEFETSFGAKIIGVLEELTPQGKAIVWAMLFDRIVRTEVGAGVLQKVYGG